MAVSNNKKNYNKNLNKQKNGNISKNNNISKKKSTTANKKKKNYYKKSNVSMNDLINKSKGTITFNDTTNQIKETDDINNILKDEDKNITAVSFDDEKKVDDTEKTSINKENLKQDNENLKKQTVIEEDDDNYFDLFNASDKDDIILEELITTNDEVLKKNNDNDFNIRSKNRKKNYIIFVFIVLIALIYLIIPKIYLNGKKEIIINYNEQYKEEGYKANLLFGDVTKNVMVDNQVTNGLLGQYKINYYLKYGMFKFKKSRKITIVDNDKPIFELPSNEIVVCPNEDIPKDINFVVMDEYDGDITNKVISKYFDNKIILSVSDSSNNKNTAELIIKRIDEEQPKITLKGNQTIYLNYGDKYVEPGYEAIDNCDNDINDKVEISGIVGTNIGSYKITYSVSDSSGNKTNITRTIVVRNGNLYNSGTIVTGTVYLTFDDGPNNGTTNVILDILKEEGVKATFFVTCNGPDNLIKRIYDEGHTVALHTATHNYAYVYSSIDNYFADLNRVSTRVKSITGIESKIIRFPGGSSNTISRNYKMGIMTELTQMVLDKGYRYFDWNVDAMDASSARSSNDVYNNVINNLSKYRSNVVLMHDTKTITRDAIRNIIRTAKAQGYNFDTIDMNTYMVRHGVNN